MKTTYSVYLLAVNGRLALPAQETTERNLLAHYFGCKSVKDGLLTKEQLLTQIHGHLRNTVQGSKDDPTVGVMEPIQAVNTSKEPLFKRGQVIPTKGGHTFKIVDITFDAKDGHIYEMEDTSEWSTQELLESADKDFLETLRMS